MQDFLIPHFMNTRAEQLKAFERLLDIMDDLREKCPWDQKQTFSSLRPLTIEEVYELGDALLANDLEEIKKEIGDVLLHLVFYAKIGAEQKAFDIADVCHAISEKLIFRHPHIYGDVKVANEEEVKKNWEKLKLKEGNTSVLGGVPKSLPAMVKATRIQEKVKGVGFDWDNAAQVWEKVNEELQEFATEADQNNPETMEAEFGDLLFSLINYARFVNINPENALERTNKKFIQRFQYLEKALLRDQKVITDLPLSVLDEYWNEAKEQLG